MCKSWMKYWSVYVLSLLYWPIDGGNWVLTALSRYCSNKRSKRDPCTRLYCHSTMQSLYASSPFFSQNVTTIIIMQCWVCFLSSWETLLYWIFFLIIKMRQLDAFASLSLIYLYPEQKKRLFCIENTIIYMYPEFWINKYIHLSWKHKHNT